MADPRRVPPARTPLQSKIFLISCSFWENVYVGTFPWRVGTPPTGNPGSAPVLSVPNQIKGLWSMTSMAGLCKELLFAVYKYDGA